jgi:hypothetical protein
MTNDELLAAAPWLLAAAVWMLALAVSLGHLWPSVGLDGFKAGWSAGPEALTPLGDDEWYASIYDQLFALGFRPAGVTWEQVRGKRKIEACAFLHPTEPWRVSAWRALGGDFRVYFVTQFAGGGAALTANYPRLTTQGPDYVARGVPTNDLAVLLDAHREDVAGFLDAGHEPLRCASLEEIVEAKYAYMKNPSVSETYRRTSWYNFSRRLLFVGGMPTAFALSLQGRRFAWAPLNAWLGALAACVLAIVWLRLARRTVLREINATQRAADRQREAAYLPGSKYRS